MPPIRIEIAPELAAEGKRLYETTLVPVREIAAILGAGRRISASRFSITANM